MPGLEQRGTAAPIQYAITVNELRNDMSKATHGIGRRSTRLHPAPQPLPPKKPDTKILLMETAERLFGQYGLDGISLREIAAAAGQSNSNVVQYHFKDKAGLIAAILDYRVRRFGILRNELMQNLTRDEPRRTRALLKVLWLPATTIVDTDGHHTFCRFLLQYLLHPHNVQHPMLHFYNADNTAKTEPGDFDSVIHATKLLRECYNSLPPDVLNRRMSALSMMFLATVVEHDNVRLSTDDKKQIPLNIEPILDMAIAALAAPA